MINPSLIGAQCPRKHVGDTKTIVFTCNETVPESSEERQTNKEILWVVWCSIPEQGEEKGGLAVPIVGTADGASACSCQSFLSGPVRKTHCASFWLCLFTSLFFWQHCQHHRMVYENIVINIIPGHRHAKSEEIVRKEKCKMWMNQNTHEVERKC